jgi:hypothetical protein
MATNLNPLTGAAQDLSNNVIRKPVTIANGATVSSIAMMNGSPLVGVDTGALTSVAFTLQNSIDGGFSFRNVEDAVTGNPFSMVVEANRYHHVSPPIRGLDLVRIVAGTAEGAARSVILVSDRRKGA